MLPDCEVFTATMQFSILFANLTASDTFLNFLFFPGTHSTPNIMGMMVVITTGCYRLTCNCSYAARLLRFHCDNAKFNPICNSYCVGHILQLPFLLWHSFNHKDHGHDGGNHHRMLQINRNGLQLTL